MQTEGENIKALHLNVVSLIPKQGLVRVNFTNSLTHEVFEFVVADKGNNGYPALQTQNDGAGRKKSGVYVRKSG